MKQLKATGRVAAASKLENKRHTKIIKAVLDSSRSRLNNSRYPSSKRKCKLRARKRVCVHLANPVSARARSTRRNKIATTKNNHQISQTNRNFFSPQAASDFISNENSSTNKVELILIESHSQRSAQRQNEFWVHCFESSPSQRKI